MYRSGHVLVQCGNSTLAFTRETRKNITIWLENLNGRIGKDGTTILQ
jgi:hypothetical protein